ncbi:MAG: hypothetical protein QXG00_02900 [Candidatus Woesearchaeota archaeon]
MKRNFSAELLFMKYAVPCAYTLVELKKITEADKKELENKTRKEIPLPKEKLEVLFSEAYRRLSEVAKKIEKNPWDKEVIIKYFREGLHNKFIDDGDGMYAKLDKSYCERCKIRIGTVEAIKYVGKKLILDVKYDDQKRFVFADFIRNPKIGDKVTIHHFYACEKV